MKDYLLYTGGTTLVGRMRTDSVENTPSNFTITELKDANSKVVDYLPVIGKFYQRTPQSFLAFKQYCIANSITLKVRDGNGDNLVTIVP